MKPIVRGSRSSLPFSRGILARSLEVVGIGPDIAYKIATSVQNALVEKEIKDLSRQDLRYRISQEIEKQLSVEISEKFTRFRRLKKKPIILLIGGSTGSGKSSISVELAHRLGITTVISTDTIREIMRYTVSKKLIPSLHSSSYLAWRKLAIKTDSDPVIFGFKEQAAKIKVGVTGIIERAIKEKSSVIINGVHILPSMIRARDYPKANIQMAFIYLSDEEKHKQRFYYREESGEIREASKYIKNFEYIRKIQDYLVGETKKSKHPCLENLHSIDTAQWIIDYLIGKADEL